MDFLRVVALGYSSMARPCYASFTGHGCRCGYRLVHCVSAMFGLHRRKFLMTPYYDAVSSVCVSKKQGEHLFLSPNVSPSFPPASSGLGIIGGDRSTLVALGGCKAEG